MSTLIGILVDVSGSMKTNAKGLTNEEGGEWARSVFSVIDELIKHDVSAENKVFAVAVGASSGSGTFDILGTLNSFQSEFQSLTYSQIIDELFNILESNGATSIRKWAQKDVIEKAVSINRARQILTELNSDPAFVRFFVHECLPPICRDAPRKVRAAAAVVPALVLPFPLNIAVGIATYAYGQQAFDGVVTSNGNTATENDVKDVVKKAKSYRLKKVDPSCIIAVNPSCIIDVHEASKILHDCVDERSLTNERVDELMEIVEPYIYGSTPLYQAIKETKDLFLQNGMHEHKKLLFVLSDGMPTDTGDLERLKAELETVNVTVVSCYITNSTNIDPKRLYSSPNQFTDSNVKFLFSLSSTITTQLVPRTIFIKRGWKLDIDNNETKLFMHINHPDILKDACDLARNVVTCQDALSDLLVSVSLDIYINQSTSGFQAQLQEENTCYANASAAVLHLAMKRILGRKDGYPDFDTLRQEIISLHGVRAANTYAVLKGICPKYRLHCREVDVSGAMKAITEKRLVVAKFRLTDNEWDDFIAFFDRSPTGVLTKKELNISRPTTLKLKGHAVVLTSFNSECFRLMNSWGTAWADLGFFRVKNASVLDLEFIDVFWTKTDLTEEEKRYYKEHGSEVAATLIQNLKGLQAAKYECPLCEAESLVTEFTGTLLQAKCPKCHREFGSNEAGNILALNMYLLSLSR